MIEFLLPFYFLPFTFRTPMDDFDDLSVEDVLLTLPADTVFDIDEVKKLLIVAKSMLIELRLRNVDANNIVALVSILRGGVNAK